MLTKQIRAGKNVDMKFPKTPTRCSFSHGAASNTAEKSEIPVTRKAPITAGFIDHRRSSKAEICCTNHRRHDRVESGDLSIPACSHRRALTSHKGARKYRINIRYRFISAIYRVTGNMAAPPHARPSVPPCLARAGHGTRARRGGKTDTRWPGDGKGSERIRGSRGGRGIE